MRVLLAEDDPLIARDVAAQLTKAGFTVAHEKDGEAALFAGETEDFAAVILDLGLPSMDGLTILKSWRAKGRDMPVIILTARGNWEERSKASMPAPTTISASPSASPNSSPGCMRCCAAIPGSRARSSPRVLSP